MIVYFLDLTAAHSYSLTDLCYITLYVKNMSEYAKMNEVYLEYINFESPPTRVCVECTLPEDCQVIMEAVGFKTKSESLWFWSFFFGLLIQFCFF